MKAEHKGQRGRFFGILYAHVPPGTPIVAPADGRVLAVQERKIGGLSIWLDHGNGFVSFHPNLQGVKVGSHEAVRRGQPIATKGVSRGDTAFYGFARLFLGDEVEPGKRAPQWLDPDTLGEGGGRLRLHTGKPVPDTIPAEQRVFMKDLIDGVLERHRGEVPRALKSWLEDVFPWYPPGYREVLKVLRPGAEAFRDGTYEWYSERHGIMMRPDLPPPAVLTHPVSALTWK
jgi:hypothetical protein